MDRVTAQVYFGVRASYATRVAIRRSPRMAVSALLRLNPTRYDISFLTLKWPAPLVASGDDGDSIRSSISTAAFIYALLNTVDMALLYAPCFLKDESFGGALLDILMLDMVLF